MSRNIYPVRKLPDHGEASDRRSSLLVSTTGTWALLLMDSDILPLPIYSTDRSSPSCATLVGTGATYLGYSYFGCATHSGALPIDWVLDRTVAPPSSSERTAIETETITTGPGARDTITSPTNADPSSITSTEAAAPNTPAGGGDIDASPNNGALIGGVVGGIGAFGQLPHR